MLPEWVNYVITIAVAVIVTVAIAYIARKPLAQALIDLLINEAVIDSTEALVEQAPDHVSELIGVLHKQMELLETMINKAGYGETDVGKVVDKLEDAVEDIITHDEPKV